MIGTDYRSTLCKQKGGTWDPAPTYRRVHYYHPITYIPRSFQQGILLPRFGAYKRDAVGCHCSFWSFFQCLHSVA
jgi:hypothetical protein